MNISKSTQLTAFNAPRPVSLASCQDRAEKQTATISVPVHGLQGAVRPTSNNGHWFDSWSRSFHSPPGSSCPHTAKRQGEDMIGHGRAQPPALPHYLSGRMRGCNGPYWAPTWWDKAVGFRNKEGDKFPTLPLTAGCRATNSNSASVSLCATNMGLGGFLDSSPTAVFPPTSHQHIHNPSWRRIEANIGCVAPFSRQTHQRKAEMVYTWQSHFVVSNIFLKRKELTRANSCSEIVTRDFNCSQLGQPMHKKDSE